MDQCAGTTPPPPPPAPVRHDHMDDPLMVGMMEQNPKIVPTPTTNIEEGNSEEHHYSTPGLLIQCGVDMEEAVFVAMRKGQIQVSKFDFEFRGFVWASCNGLVVESDVKATDPIYIANPATNQRLTLPQYPCPIAPMRRCLIAYAAASMQYKLVLSPYDVPDVNQPYCAILTVGVDEPWRIVDTKHLSPPCRKICNKVPLSTEGFIHWASPFGTSIVTLNVETETVTETPIPIPQGGDTYYVSNGSSIALLVECGDFSWEFWNWNARLENDGEWTELGKIDLENRKPEFEHLLRGNPRRDGAHHLTPVSWLNEEVLVFAIFISRACLLYNVRTREIGSIQLEFYPFHHSFKVHRNSLCWF